MIKRTFSKIVRRIAPSTMESLEMMHVMRAEVGDLGLFYSEIRGLREEVQAMMRETNQTRRDSLRIAELTDIVVETLARIERTAGANPKSEAS